MGRYKANWEVPTTRPNSRVAATRPLGATGPMMNAVGGTSIHWMTQSWRFLPWNFKIPLGVEEALRRRARSRTDSTSIDWPFDYNELEPYYDKLEYFAGVSGQAGNVQGQDRSAAATSSRGRAAPPYPLPPLRPPGWTELTDEAAKGDRLAPVSRPGGHPLEGVSRQGRLHVLRLLRLQRAATRTRRVDERGLHPAGGEDEEPEDRHAGARAPRSRSTTTAGPPACST